MDVWGETETGGEAGKGVLQESSNDLTGLARRPWPVPCVTQHPQLAAYTPVPFEMTPSPPPSAAPPDWTPCAAVAGPGDPVGCRGYPVDPYDRCLPHLSDVDRTAYLRGLGPGSAVDHRGTSLDTPLLQRLLRALHDPATGNARFGFADFGSATFENGAYFESATFEGGARFGSATFQRTASLGPLVCAGRVRLSETVFGAAVTIALAARHLECHRTRWSATAALQLRYATVDFTHAVVAHPLSIAAEPSGFVIPSVGQVDEHVLASAAGDPVRIVSLRGVDAAHLMLTDIDLTDCRFTGAFHLDKLRIEGKCTFAVPPERRRWTQRQVLAEEHHWRALTTANPAAPRGWRPGPHHPSQGREPYGTGTTRGRILETRRSAWMPAEASA